MIVVALQQQNKKKLLNSLPINACDCEHRKVLRGFNDSQENDATEFYYLDSTAHAMSFSFLRTLEDEDKQEKVRILQECNLFIGSFFPPPESDPWKLINCELERAAFSKMVENSIWLPQEKQWTMTVIITKVFSLDHIFSIQLKI